MTSRRQSPEGFPRPPDLRDAVRQTNELDLPVVVYEGLSHRYSGANRRIHRWEERAPGGAGT